MVNNKRQQFQPQDEAAYTIACPICQAIYTPLPSHTYLLQSSQVALESAFMSMCHFCFRCRRPSCPSCWDDVHGLCGICGLEAALPFRSISEPLAGILFPPVRSIQTHPTHPVSARLLCITPGIFQSDIVPSERVTTIPIRALNQHRSRQRSSAQKQATSGPHSLSPLEPDLTELATRPEWPPSSSANEKLATRPERPALTEYEELPTRPETPSPAVPSQIKHHTPTTRTQRPTRTIRRTPADNQITVRTGRRIHSESAARQQTRIPHPHKEKPVTTIETRRSYTTKKMIDHSIPQLLSSEQSDAIKAKAIKEQTASNGEQSRTAHIEASTFHHLEMIFTILSLTIFSIVFLLIVAALASQNTNAFINDLIHIDIRAELSYLWKLMTLIHF